MKKKFIAIIPARGGSKGLKRKNILSLNGKPLIAWTIEFVKNSGIFERCITSTDDKEIANISLQYGSEVPFLRSKELSSDEASSSAVILDVIERCKLDSKDILFLFEPTSPYRKLTYLNSIIKLFENNKTECVVSVCESSSKSYVFQYERNSLGKLVIMDFNKTTKNIYRRQDVKSTYLLDGSFYASTVENFLKTKSFISENTDTVITDFYTSLEIDSKEEFELLEMIYKKFGCPF